MTTITLHAPGIQITFGWAGYPHKHLAGTFSAPKAVSQPATPTLFLIIRFFKKRGISIPIDGFEDEEINIKGLEKF